MDLDGLQVDWEKLFELSHDFWQAELDNIEKFLTDQINEDLPPEMMQEILAFRQRMSKF